MSHSHMAVRDHTSGRLAEQRTGNLEEHTPPSVHRPGTKGLVRTLLFALVFALGSFLARLAGGMVPFSRGKPSPGGVQ